MTVIATPASQSDDKNDFVNRTRTMATRARARSRIRTRKKTVILPQTSTPLGNNRLGLGCQRERAMSDGSISTIGMNDFTASTNIQNIVHTNDQPIAKNQTSHEHIPSYHNQNEDKESHKKVKCHRRRRDFRRAPHLQAALDRIKERQHRESVAAAAGGGDNEQPPTDRILHQKQQQPQQRSGHERQSPQSRLLKQPSQRQRWPSPIQTALDDAPFVARLFQGTKVESIGNPDEWVSSMNITAASNPYASSSRSQSKAIPTLGQLSPERLLHLSPDRKLNLKLASIARDVRKRQRKRLQKQRTEFLSVNYPDRSPGLSNIIDVEEDLLEQHDGWNHGGGGRFEQIAVLRNHLERLRSFSRKDGGHHAEPRSQLQRGEGNTRPTDDNKNKDAIKSPRKTTQTAVQSQNHRLVRTLPLRVNTNRHPKIYYGGNGGSPDSLHQKMQSTRDQSVTNSLDARRLLTNRSQSTGKNTTRQTNIISYNPIAHQLQTSISSTTSSRRQSLEGCEDDNTEHETSYSESDISDSDESDEAYKSGPDVTYTLPSLTEALRNLLPQTSPSSENDRTSVMDSLLHQTQNNPSRVVSPMTPRISEQEVHIIDHNEIHQSISREDVARRHFLPVSPANKTLSPMPIFKELDDHLASDNSTPSTTRIMWTGRKNRRCSPTPSETARSLLHDVEDMQKASKRMQYKQQQMQNELSVVQERFHGSFDAMENRVERNRRNMKDNILNISNRHIDPSGSKIGDQSYNKPWTNESERARHFLPLSPSYKYESMETETFKQLTGQNCSDDDDSVQDNGDKRPLSFQYRDRQKIFESGRRNPGYGKDNLRDDDNDDIDDGEWTHERSTGEIPTSRDWALNHVGAKSTAIPPRQMLRISESLLSTASSDDSTINPSARHSKRTPPAAECVVSSNPFKNRSTIHSTRKPATATDPVFSLNAFDDHHKQLETETYEPPSVAYIRRDDTIYQPPSMATIVDHDATRMQRKPKTYTAGPVLPELDVATNKSSSNMLLMSNVANADYGRTELPTATVSSPRGKAINAGGMLYEDRNDLEGTSTSDNYNTHSSNGDFWSWIGLS